MSNKEKISILLCEADVNYGMLFCEYLQGRGYSLTVAQDGDEGWHLFTHNTCDLCIFDTELPLRSGIELTRDIRAMGSETPIIFFTDSKQTDDILEGYRAGADDYVVKPCSMEIIICKIESIMRRVRRMQEDETTVFELGGFTYDAVAQTLVRGNETIRLSTKESDVLTLLCRRMNRVVERNGILKSIWQNDSYFSNRSLSVYINHLRNHLASEPNVKIMSVHGKGYKIVVG